MEVDKIKFAWIPTLVYTWRKSPTEAIIWMQHYKKRGRNKYCDYLGFFSYEF